MARVQGWEPVCGARADRPGLRRIYGALDADSARGLALRMDHGSQYLSDHFLNQIRYWGIRPSYGFVEEPETNGVAERWNRTLKEQAIHGRIFQNLKEVRAAVTAFVERYNTTWRLEKLGYHTPIEAREAHELRRGGVALTCVQRTGCGTRRPVAESPDTTKEEHGKTDQLLLKAKKQYQAAVRGEARLRQDMEDDRRFRFCIGVPPSSNGWLCVLRHQRTPAARQRRGESDGRGCNGTRATRTPCVARMASLA